MVDKGSLHSWAANSTQRSANNYLEKWPMDQEPLTWSERHLDLHVWLLKKPTVPV